jgi:hypothetical protein
MNSSTTLVKASEKQLHEKQAKIVNKMAEIDKSLLSYFYKIYMTQMYYFINYNIKNDRDICYKLAIIFSEYPDSFSGKVRTEIQLDNSSVTLCINDWIKCKPLPLPCTESVEVEFQTDQIDVEYYIYTVNNFPVIIFLSQQG